MDHGPKTKALVRRSFEPSVHIQEWPLVPQGISIPYYYYDVSRQAADVKRPCNFPNAVYIERTIHWKQPRLLPLGLSAAPDPTGDT